MRILKLCSLLINKCHYLAIICFSLSSLLEKNNIVSSPAAWKRPTHFKEGEEEHEDLGVDREKKPVSRKPTVTNTVKSNEATVNIEISKPNVPRSSAVHAILNNAEPKPITTVPSAVPISIADYNSASLKVPSTLDLSNNVVGGGLACFWTQCREALSFCCATLYPSFLGVIVTAYLLHFTTNERVFASFAVVFTILSGLVLGFLFVAVVPFVVLTRTVERYFREKDSPESVFVNLLTRMMLLLITILVLYGIQSLPLLF